MVQKFPYRTENLELTTKILCWNKKYGNSIYYANRIIQTDANSRFSYFYKALAYKAIEKYDSSLVAIDKLISIDTANIQAQKNRKEILLLKLNQTVGFGGRVEIFSNSEFQRTSLFVEFQLRKKWVPLSFRINYANRFSLHDAQFELDVYPKINEKLYIFGNAGFSNNKLFPSYRLAVEPYLLLPARFEFSASYRHINFNSTSSDIYTASISKYIGNAWLGARMYYSVNNFGPDVLENRTTQTYEGAFKYFFSNRFHFAELRFGAGNNPDDAFLYSNFKEVRFFQSRFLTLGYTHFFNERWFWRCNYVYNLQLPDTRENFTINSVSLSI